jgi:hypothetical protein
MPKLLRKCWAEPLGDCKGDLTREHVFADGVLNGLMKVRRGKKLIPTTSITVKFLCEYHNNVVLSDIDQEAAKYLNTLMAMMGQVELKDRWTPAEPKNVVVNGWKVERWFAKTLVNMVAAGIGYDTDGPEIGMYFPNGFREYVFGKTNEPPAYPFGLWIMPPANLTHPSDLITNIHMNRFHTYNGKWSDEKRNPQYVRFQFGAASYLHYGMFNLSLFEKPKITDQDIDKMFTVKAQKNLHYRPKKLGFSRVGSSISKEPDNIITFDWSLPN